MSAPSSAEVESAIARLSSTKSVRGVLVLNAQGILIRHAGEIFDLADPSEVISKYVNAALKLVAASKDAVGGLDIGDVPRFLRVRTRKWEIMITPDEKYTLVVVQDPSK
ncbi:hypothetical protein BT69DRAFT_1286734 [Atractiella rhizophila]|nr:hypothetical protein BT69DRAFT_1286734 [Atractiella rhizophila]